MKFGRLRRLVLVAVMIGLTVGPSLGARADAGPLHQIYLPLVSQNVNASQPTATATP